jgi:rubrerythrin
MTDLFNASEIVEVALRIEQNGGTFYGLLADKMSDPQVKKLFGDLAKEERKHFETFQQIHARASHWEPLGTYAAEYRDYMDCLASHNVFNRKNTAGEVTGRITDKKEALKYAQGVEKDSILFYMEMKEAVPPGEREIIEDLIRQEKIHLTRLIEMERQ